MKEQPRQDTDQGPSSPLTGGLDLTPTGSLQIPKQGLPNDRLLKI